MSLDKSTRTKLLDLILRCNEEDSTISPLKTTDADFALLKRSLKAENFDLSEFLQSDCLNRHVSRNSPTWAAFEFAHELSQPVHEPKRVRKCRSSDDDDETAIVEVETDRFTVTSDSTLRDIRPLFSATVNEVRGNGAIGINFTLV